jgi:hypothetical protein
MYVYNKFFQELRPAQKHLAVAVHSLLQGLQMGSKPLTNLSGRRPRGKSLAGTKAVGFWVALAMFLLDPACSLTAAWQRSFVLHFPSLSTPAFDLASHH